VILTSSLSQAFLYVCSLGHLHHPVYIGQDVLASVGEKTLYKELRVKIRTKIERKVKPRCKQDSAEKLLFVTSQR